jgi:hypothetical protein
MSDVLRGRVDPDLEDEARAGAADALEKSVVSVIANVQIGTGKSTAIVGILRSVLFELEPELEFKVTLDDALGLVQAQNPQFLGFELHHGERVIKVPGPFTIKGARIDDIDPAHGLCILALGLKRPPKT